MNDCCNTCTGKGFIGWLSLAEAASPRGDAYMKSMECPDCHGSGGWTGTKPDHRMTLDDLRGVTKELP